jgi:beta-N-acetylhexosaminidase
MTIELPLGPVICDVAGFSLTPEERERLRHPLVGGVILFTRNYRDPDQLAALTAEIHALRTPSLPVTVDHEGGRVQRFREGFTRLPPMGALGAFWKRDAEAALALARTTGFVLAADLVEHGVDLSFTPVLDLDYGRSQVIGDRGFSGDPESVATLAEAVVAGLADAGMGAVGKHFPGHGWAEADSHVAIPEDERDFDAIWASDIAPYRSGLLRKLSGVMPAHVIYRRIDPNPAGFSPFWLQDVLRGRLGFDGVIFSDDLTMEGATVVGGIVARAAAAHAAGCDMVLVCNRPDLADELLANWTPTLTEASLARIARLGARPNRPISAARLGDARREVADFVASLA